MSPFRYARLASLAAVLGLLSCSHDTIVAALAPSVSGLSPDAVAQGGTTVVTITGANFVSGASIAISGTGVTATGVSVASATSITTGISVAADAALGARTLTVTTAAGTSAAATLTIKPAVPLVTSVAPSAGAQGATVAVAITGANFIAGATTVSVSGADVSVSGVNVASPTSLTANFVVGAGAALGDRNVTVTTAGGTSIARTFTVRAPTPTLASLSAATLVAGTSATITLGGANFISGATVGVTGTGVSVDNVSITNATSMTARFTAAIDAPAGARAVTVTTAGGTSGAQTLTVNSATPIITSIAPPSGVRGNAIGVAINGASFLAGATIAVSGGGVTVSQVNVASATSVTAIFTIDSAAALGARNVTVTTTGGTSAPQTFTVLAGPPTLTQLVPGRGVPGTTLIDTLFGTNFVPDSTTVASEGGVAVSNVIVVSSTMLTARFTIDSRAGTGARQITVVTPGGTSNAKSFTVMPPGPTLASVAPGSGTQGGAQTITLTGTTFVAGATVNVSGTGVTVSNTNVVNGTTITADFAVSAGATLGAHNVTVTTASGTTGAQPFTVLPPPPTLGGLSLTTGAQTGSQTITLTGTNFQAGATTVNVAGSNVTVSNVNVGSGTSLTADFAVGAGAALGGRNVTVTTASGTSGAQTFTVVVPPTITGFDALATHLFATQPSRLRWATSNAATCSINNGVGTVASCNDSLFVTPGTTKTYTLSATSAGATVTANFQLFANEPGRWVYSTSSGGAVGTHVHQYSLDATTGNLTAIGTGNVAAGTSTEGIAVDPAGRNVYAVNQGGNNLSEYSIDATTGALTALTTIATGTNPVDIAVDPTGRFVYVVNNNGGGTGSISQYTIGGTGLLTSNGTTALGTNPQGIAIDPTGRFVYAANRNGKSIQEFSINPDGTLSSLGTIATSGFLAQYMAVDPTGRFLYLTHDTDGRFSQYSIGADGTLTLLGGGPVNIGPGTERPVTVDPTGRFAYVVDFNNAILHEFSIDQATGILTRFAAPTLPHTLPTTQTIQHFAIDPQGKFAYGTDSNNGNVIIFTIDATTGALSPVSAPLNLVAGGTSPWGVVVSR